MSAVAAAVKLPPPGRPQPVDLEFLPAALEIQETPPLPVARWLLWSIIAFAAIAIAWASLGKVDIVGVASGKIVPSGRVKTIQPFETGVVASIHVTDGDWVEAGQSLVSLDPTPASADLARLEEEQRELALDRARLRAQLETLPACLADEAACVVIDGALAVEGAAPAQRRLHAARAVRQLQELHANAQALAQDMHRNRAEQAAVSERIGQIDAVVPLLSERATSLASLADRKLGARNTWLELEEDRVELVRERDVQRAQLTVLDATHGGLAERRAALVAQTESGWLSELAAVETRFAGYAEELVKARRRIELLTLRAPVAGTVQQLAVHTVGGVVTPAQPLMLIVPEEAALQVEARVPNKDIGFVHAGQAAVVKIETFPFTRYGTIPGTVTNVSDDALADEKLGLVYAAQVALARSTMQVDGRTVRLGPGMTVTVEFAMGERRLIEFLLSPLLKYGDEAGRER